MHKVLLAKDLEHLFMTKGGFLNRADIRVLSATTNNDILSFHSAEEADLIITSLDLPGIKVEELFAIIRKNAKLREVSVIIICKDTLDHRERCKNCGANAVFTVPVDIVQLSAKVRQFLNVAPRMFYRAALAVAIQGKFRDRPRPFWTVNISASGMLIRSEEALAKGDALFFSFYLPDGTHISGYGEIVWTNHLETGIAAHLYGIRFTNIDPSMHTAIAELISRQT